MRSLILILLLFALPAGAADYWPTEVRTYVFEDDDDQFRFIIESATGGGDWMFRFLGAGCDISWPATVAADGTMEIAMGSFFCAGLIEPVLDLTFDPGSLLFDPTKIGGPIQALDAEADGQDYVVSVRLGAPRDIDFGGEMVEVVSFELGISDPLLLAPLVNADLSITDGPLRINGVDRTEVLDGIVRDDTASWGGVKARY